MVNYQLTIQIEKNKSDLYFLLLSNVVFKWGRILRKVGAPISWNIVRLGGYIKAGHVGFLYGSFGYTYTPSTRSTWLT